MPVIVEWPSNLIISDRSDPQLVANTRSGGMAINGFEQIASPLSQRWRWKVDVPVHREDVARSLRVVLTRLQGRYGYLRMRLCDHYRVSRAESGAEGGEVPHSDDAFFSDDSGYAFTAGSVRPSAGAAVGTTTLTLDTDIPLISGTFFSVNGWLHIIEDVLDGGVVQFAPPLRDPVTVEDEVSFDSYCYWKVSADDVGQLMLRLGKFGTAQIDLVEPLARDF